MMINTIFCLSMPGGHMTYLALLTKLLLGHLPVKYEYIRSTGSAHNAESFFPDDLQHYLGGKWDHWFNNSIENFTQNGICIFRDGWGSTDLEIWQDKINQVDNSLCVISSPISKTDWYYCWLNFAQKMPLGLFGQLKMKSKLFPIWHLLKSKHKYNSFVKAMPIFPLSENLQLNCDNYRFPTTLILQEDFPILLSNFLNKQKLNAFASNKIIEFHKFFISKQIYNYNLSQQLADGIKWQPRNMFDKVLFDWIDTNPWEELE